MLNGGALTYLGRTTKTCVAAQRTLFEVEKYIPKIAAKSEKPESLVFEAFQLPPVVAKQAKVYDDCLEKATKLIGQRDAKDIDVLALALALNAPIWSNDADFQGLPEVQVYTTAELLEQ